MNPKAARKKALMDKKAGKNQPQGLFVNFMRAPILEKRKERKQ